MEADESGFYTWNVEASDMEIEITVKRLYSFTFVTEHATVTKAVMDDSGSIICDESGSEIWEEVTVADTIQCPLDRLYRLRFKIQAEDGYILRTFSANSAGILFREVTSWNEPDGRYRLDWNEKQNVRDETKIFVTAGEPEQYEVAFNYPENLSVAVYTRTGENNYVQAALTDNKITVAEGTRVRFSLETTDSSQGFFARYTVDGTETIIEPSVSDTDNGKVYEFSLGALTAGNVSVTISAAVMHKITFQTDTAGEMNSAIRLRLYNEALSSAEVDGMEAVNQYTALLPDGYELCFAVSSSNTEMAAYQVSAGTDSGEIPLQYDSDLGANVFRVTPTGDMTIQVSISAAEFKFDYVDEDIADIKVYKASDSSYANPLELTENKGLLLSDGKYPSLNVRIKPAAGKRLQVMYNTDDGNWSENVYGDYMEDGYFEYSVFTGDPCDCKLTIKGYETCRVTFKEETGTIDIKRVTKIDDWWEESWDDNGMDMSEGSCTITADKGKALYFSIPAYMDEGYRLEYVSTTEDAEGSLPVYEYYWDNEWKIYRIIPVEDMTVTIKKVKLADYTVSIAADEGVGQCTVLCNEETPEQGADGAYTVKEGSELVIRPASVTAENRVKVTYRTGEGEWQEAAARYYYYTNAENVQSEAVEHYLRIAGNTEIKISVEPVGEYQVTFENAEALGTIKIWENGKASDTGTYTVTNGAITLKNDKIYYFDILPPDGKGITSVSAAYGTADSIVLKRQYDAVETEGWLIGTGYGMTQDVTIRAELFDAYTLSFDTTQMGSGESVYSWTEYDIDNWYPDIKASRIAVPEEGSYTFFIDKEEYTVTADSEAFEIQKTYGRSEDDSIYILYTIALKEGASNPGKVTVSFEKQTVESHTLTLDYPDDTVISINAASYKDDIYKALTADSNKQVTVSESPLVLRLRMVTGCEPAVTIKGASDSEAETLTAYRLEGNTGEYYIGNLTEDKTITVTATQSGSSRKYYDVGFAAQGATVRDSQYRIPYDTDGYLWEDDEYLPYNVEQGASISFITEPYYGYEIEGVYVGDTKIEPQNGIYTVTPVQKTLITVRATKEGSSDNKYSVTFSYPGQVQSVAVDGYELGTDNTLSVPAGTTLSFAVTLAGEDYEIQSVLANGREISYDEKTGKYTLTISSEDTVIAILTAGKTPVEPDKKHNVTFVYPETVKAILFKDGAYTPENNAISVPDGTKVYFKADLTEGYEIDSITTDTGLTVDLADGYYVLTVSGDVTVTITARPAQIKVTGITIEGIKDGTVELFADLIQKYQIVVTPSGADVSGLRAEVAPIEGAQTAPAVMASIENCVLRIDTTKVTADESAVIKIFDDRTKAYVEGGILTVNVKAPSPDDTYETKLTLQKGTTTIYTGQSGIVSATAKYSTGTTIKKIADVKDTTVLTGDGEALKVWEADDKIYAAATEKTQLGKHTLEVSAYAPGTLERARAVVTVNVVRGIETLKVTVPTTKLYKPANKKATVKATVIYNSGTTAPKAKKVIYEVQGTDGRAVTGITVKNGTVTVDKSFTVSDTDAGKNTFRIHVKANDYGENQTEAYSDWITLSSEPLEIESIYVLDKDGKTDAYTVVVGTDNQKITTDKLENAVVVAMKKGSAPLETGRSYTESELESAGRIDASLLTYKSSNKALGVNAAGGISMTKYANKIKLTLTTADGGKRKKDIQFLPEYAAPDELQLRINDAEDKPINGDSYSGQKQLEASFAGTANTVLTLCVQEKTGDAGWEDIDACVNHMVKVTGGKIIIADTLRGVYQIVVTGSRATVTLTDKTVKNRPKKQYTITNTAYTQVKAPKVSLKYYNNNDSLAAKSMAPGSLEGRKVEFTLKNASSYSYARLEADKTVTGGRSYNTPQGRLYEKLLTAMEEDAISIKDGKFTIEFDDSDIPAGSYKLKLALSNAGGDSFKAETGLISITLKVAKPKAVKGSFKPKTSYTLKEADGYKVNIAYTAKNLLKDAAGKEQYELELLNVNIKGKENEFLSYFVLDTSGTAPVLKLRDGITAEQIAALKTSAQKDNLTGCIAYTAKCGDDGYGSPYTIMGTVKVKVKLK